MSRVLLIVPPFWDPVCAPQGIASLKAYCERAGHEVVLFDFNTLPHVFGAQSRYFAEGCAQIPAWRRWNIARNGTGILAMHQLVYLRGRRRPDYRDRVLEVLNADDAPMGPFAVGLDTSRFDAIFDGLYAEIQRTLSSLLARVRPDVVGCSLFNSTWPATLFLLRRVKGLMPDVRTVVGGPGPLMGLTRNADEVSGFFEQNPFIDYFVVGEGERALLRILDEPDLPRQILSHDDPSFEGVGRPRGALALDQLPDPSFDGLRLDGYLQLSVTTSRGCPWQCSFCAETMFWQGFRSRKARAAADSIEALAHRHRRRSFYVCDSLSNGVIGPLTSELSRRDLDLRLDCYLRADRSATRLERARAWRAGGLRRARLGMESASQRILDDMVKMTTPRTMSETLHALSEADIATSTLWIVAYPGETEREFQETLHFIRDHRDHLYQADAWLYQHHPDGLGRSDQLQAAVGSRPRYSDALSALLQARPYITADDLSLGDRYDRLARFTAAIRDYGVPNPYELTAWAAADDRWRALGRSPLELAQPGMALHA